MPASTACRVAVSAVCSASSARKQARNTEQSTTTRVEGVALRGTAGVNIGGLRGLSPQLSKGRQLDAAAAFHISREGLSCLLAARCNRNQTCDRPAVEEPGQMCLGLIGANAVRQLCSPEVPTRRYNQSEVPAIMCNRKTGCAREQRPPWSGWASVTARNVVNLRSADLGWPAEPLPADRPLRRSIGHLGKAGIGWESSGHGWIAGTSLERPPGPAGTRPSAVGSLFKPRRPVPGPLL